MEQGTIEALERSGIDGIQFAAIQERFAESDYGLAVASETRYDWYRPDHITKTEWVELLGPEVDMLEHMPATFMVASTFIQECRAQVPTDETVQFSEDEANTILLAALTHNWGKSLVGDMSHETSSSSYEKRLNESFRSIFQELLSDAVPGRLRAVEDIASGKAGKLSYAFNIIKRICWAKVALVAFERSLETNDEILRSRLEWMTAGILSNHIKELISDSDTYAGVKSFLSSNQQTITEAFNTIHPGIFEINEQREFEKKKSYLVGGELWRRHIDVEAAGDNRHRRGRSILEFVEGREKLDSKYLEARIMADNELELLGTIEFDELVERLRRITFRGIFDSSGRPMRPYENAKFTLTTVQPQNSMMTPPTIHVRTSDEALFTPQPTIYADQLEIIRTVDYFLGNHNRRLAAMNEVVQYEWLGRGRFDILPPIVERQQFRLQNGAIDLDALAESFSGAYVKDDRGRLHELAARKLDGFYVDSHKSINGFDVFHDNLELLNYGAPYSGDWGFYIICDGSHRIDYAIEDQHEPIAVILVEPEGDRPLLPYYAMPMPFRPTIRLSSKRAERMYPRLERDKFHLLVDELRKTLHYDWTEAGLNVSSLRAKREIN